MNFAWICFFPAFLFALDFCMAAPLSNACNSDITISKLEAIVPSSLSCSGAPYPTECRTASEALPHILQSFKSYDVTSAGAQAAILSTIAFESGDFKYQKNYFPGNPGQGTRNMQSAAFNLEYAQSIASLSNRITDAEAAGPNGIRDLLITSDDWDFGSAAWFLTTQCGEDVKDQLAQGGDAGFSAYLGCIGTTETEERQEYWSRASNVLC